MLQACCNEMKPSWKSISHSGAAEIHITWFKACRSCSKIEVESKKKKKVPVPLVAASYPIRHCCIHGVREYFELNFDCSGSCIMWVLQCQPCSAVWLILSSNTFSFQRWHTHHVCCESLCLFWQNVGEVKANKTNKQVSQQTATCVRTRVYVRLLLLFSSDTHTHTLCLWTCVFILPQGMCCVGGTSIQKSSCSFCINSSFNISCY